MSQAMVQPKLSNLSKPTRAKLNPSFGSLSWTLGLCDSGTLECPGGDTHASCALCFDSSLSATNYQIMHQSSDRAMCMAKTFVSAAGSRDLMSNNKGMSQLSRTTGLPSFLQCLQDCGCRDGLR